MIFYEIYNYKTSPPDEYEYVYPWELEGIYLYLSMINIILILGIYIYYKFKKGVRDINEMVEDKEVFKDFFGNNM